MLHLTLHLAPLSHSCFLDPQVIHFLFILEEKSNQVRTHSKCLLTGHLSHLSAYSLCQSPESYTPHPPAQFPSPCPPTSAAFSIGSFASTLQNLQKLYNYLLPGRQKSSHHLTSVCLSLSFPFIAIFLLYGKTHIT